MSQESPDNKEEHQTKFYIDKQILNQNVEFLDTLDSKISNFDRVYDINGEIFREDDRSADKDQTKYLEFEVQYDDSDDNATASAAAEAKDINITDVYMDVSHKETKEGVIVNSSIFLTSYQWNTLIAEECFEYCFVCDEIVDSLMHFKMWSHVDNLEKSKPLKKFNLSITRENGSSLHCAVCNIVFNKDDDKDHYESTNHKDRMSYALNVAQALVSSENDNNESNENTKSNDGARHNVESKNWENSSDYESSEGFYDYDFNKDNDSNVKTGKVDSYASVAKKPNIVSKYIDQVIGGKRYFILFEYWHMIIFPKPNQFYCMICKTFEHISVKAHHCLEGTHLENLEKCFIIKKYERFIIRQIFSDLNHYHCGICNKLILKTHIDEHIMNYHEKRAKSLSEETKVKEVSETENKAESMKNEPNVANIDYRCTNPYVSQPVNISRAMFDINNVNPTIYNDIIFQQFGCSLRISFASYNIILKSVNGLYCVICNYFANEEIMKCHVQHQHHKHTLEKIHFEPYFGSNLIRLVHNQSHCGICNILFDISLTMTHVANQIHLALLNQALQSAIAPIAMKPDDSKSDVTQTDSNKSMNQAKIVAQESKIESSSENLDESIEGYDNEFIYLVFKKKKNKITFSAYNSLIAVGDGTRYCFVCATLLESGCEKEHIQSASHTTCMEKCSFLDKNDKHILRQTEQFYHCCTCNVIFSKNFLNAHLLWPVQEIKTNRTIRKADILSGIKFLTAKIQKEDALLQMQESKMKMLIAVEIKPKSDSIEIKKESKMVIVNSKVLKLSWDAWHGISRLTAKKDGYLCCICNVNLRSFEINYHIHEEMHANALERNFDKQYYPNLIRRVHNNMLNCLTCNQIIPNKSYIIWEHVNGRKHKIQYQVILGNSVNANDFLDCTDNILYL